METKTRKTEFTHKQLNQIKKLCAEFQPHQQREEVVFLEIVQYVRQFCYTPFVCYSKTRTERIIDGYYIYGIKKNNKTLTREHIYQLNKHPMLNSEANGLSYIIKMILIRACRDLLRSPMRDEDHRKMSQVVDKIRDIIFKR